MRFLFVFFALLASCSETVVETPKEEKGNPWAIGKDWEPHARLCMSNRENRLGGCIRLQEDYRESRSIGDCAGYAFYQLRKPEGEIDLMAAERAEVGCQTDLGILQYDGREAYRLGKRAKILQAEIVEARRKSKDEIDEIGIRRLEKRVSEIQAERAELIGSR